MIILNTWHKESKWKWLNSLELDVFISRITCNQEKLVTQKQKSISFVQATDDTICMSDPSSGQFMQEKKKKMQYVITEKYLCMHQTT